MVTPERGRTLLGAISDTGIPINTEIVVIDTMGDVVKVMSKKALDARKRGKGGPKRTKAEFGRVKGVVAFIPR